jgi:hypothetical protein
MDATSLVDGIWVGAAVSIGLVVAVCGLAVMWVALGFKSGADFSLSRSLIPMSSA